MRFLPRTGHMRALVVLGAVLAVASCTSVGGDVSARDAKGMYVQARRALDEQRYDDATHLYSVLLSAKVAGEMYGAATVERGYAHLKSGRAEAARADAGIYLRNNPKGTYVPHAQMLAASADYMILRNEKTVPKDAARDTISRLEALAVQAPDVAPHGLVGEMVADLRKRAKI